MCSAMLSIDRGGVCRPRGRTMSVSISDGIPEVVIADRHAVERPTMENFVAAEFLQQYSANVKNFMPWLLGLSCHEKLVGVAGLRPAADSPLFIEQYLDRSIEDEVELHTGLPVARQHIIEIGNLAGHYPGVTRALFPLLTELLYKRGYQWCVCNTTPTVQNALLRLGIPIVPMVRAMPDRLGVARFAWGSYYATETTVIAISPAAAHDALMDKPDLLAMCSMALAEQSGLLPLAG
jgi:hypothetical protein